MNNVFISGGKRFKWKARALPLLVDERKVCDSCNGKGYKKIYGNEDEQCIKCGGSGKERWLEPFDLELEEFLQTKIEEYYREKRVLKELFHDD